MVDLNGDRLGTREEIERWLNLQRRINHGQLLITILTDGGLFEWLDSDHNGALTPRELKNAWQRLVNCGFTDGDYLQVDRIRPLTMMIASQGLPECFAKREPIQLEWFRKMDRNEDGDITQREFTGLVKSFIVWIKTRMSCSRLPKPCRDSGGSLSGRCYMQNMILLFDQLTPHLMSKLDKDLLLFSRFCDLRRLHA